MKKNPRRIPNKNRLNVLISTDEKEILRKQADEKNLTLSTYVRQILAEKVAEG